MPNEWCKALRMCGLQSVSIDRDHNNSKCIEPAADGKQANFPVCAWNSKSVDSTSFPSFILRQS